MLLNNDLKSEKHKSRFFGKNGASGFWHPRQLPALPVPKAGPVYVLGLIRINSCNRIHISKYVTHFLKLFSIRMASFLNIYIYRQF